MAKLSETAYNDLETAMATEALEWLQSNAPDLAAGVETAVRAGATPYEIYLKVVRTLGTHRQAIAKRCQLAAAALRDN